MRKPKLTPDEFLAQIDTSPDASLTSTETEPVDEMDEVDEIDPLGDEDQDDDDAIEEPDDAIVAAVEPDPEPDAQEPVAAFAYTPSLPADVFTADENAYIRNCEDSTDPELRIKGRQFETFRMQQYHARAEQMGSSHLGAIPGAVMETYGSAVRDYMSQVPASRRNDPNLSVEVVLATAYEHAKQLGGDPQAALARVIGDLNSRYNPNQVSQNQTVPPPRRAAALPATIPPGARQPSSSVASSAAVTPVRTGSKYEQSVKMLMDEGMSREDARLAVNGSKL